jgi:predicted HicB family RNase H-like nuclease
MSKPNYRAVVTFDSERKVFSARAPELEHCSGEGASRAEAIAKLEEEIDAQLANMLSHGSTPPRAVDEETFTGEITAKVSKLLHRDLAYQARSEGIDLDHLVGELLAAAMESRKQHRGVRSGNTRPREDHQPHDNVGNRFEGGGGGRQRGFGGRGNNAHLLDDRANFIEYVRGLEQSGQQGGPSRFGGHGGPGGGGGGGRGRRGRGGGGRGGNPNHGGPNRGMHGGGMQGGGMHGGGAPRPQQHAGGGNGNFGGGNGGGPNGNQQHGGGEHGNAGHQESQASAPSGGPPPSHDPDSSGNV